LVALHENPIEVVIVVVESDEYPDAGSNMLQNNESHEQVQNALETSADFQKFVDEDREFVLFQLYCPDETHHLGDTDQLVDLSDSSEANNA
jgi:hypothetical protein